MSSVQQHASFSLYAGPQMFIGAQALDHLPYLLHQHRISRPTVLHAPDREGSSLMKSVADVFEECGTDFLSASYRKNAVSIDQQTDALISLGSVPARAAHQLSADAGLPLALVLTDIQHCTEAGNIYTGVFPDYLFLDPSAYPQRVPELTARTAIAALTLLTESLQQDRAHDLSCCYAEAGLGRLQAAAGEPIRSLQARHAAAEAAVNAALVRSNTGAGTVSSVCQALSSSGFTVPSETAAVLLPLLLAQTDQHDSRFLSSAGGSGEILRLLGIFVQSAGFPPRADQILALAKNTAELSHQRHGRDILRLFDTAGAGS